MRNISLVFNNLMESFCLDDKYFLIGNFFCTHENQNKM